MTNIVHIMVRGFLEFLVINIVAVPFLNDPTLCLWYALCILLAFILRLAILYDNNTLTPREALKQVMFTIGYTFLMILVWFSWLKWETGFEVYLFLNSLFASFMVGELQVLFKSSIKNAGRAWLRATLKKFLATEDIKEIDK